MFPTFVSEKQGSNMEQSITSELLLPKYVEWPN